MSPIKKGKRDFEGVLCVRGFFFFWIIYFGLVFEREIHSVLNHSLGVVRGHDFMDVSGPRGEEEDLGGVIKCIASVCLIKKQALGFPDLHI